MFVATVPGKDSGAGILAYQDFMDKAAARVGGDFFILPSSIHEILLVKDTGDRMADELRNMVKHINKTELRPGEYSQIMFTTMIQRNISLSWQRSLKQGRKKRWQELK